MALFRVLKYESKSFRSVSIDTLFLLELTNSSTEKSSSSNTVIGKHNERDCSGKVKLIMRSIWKQLYISVRIISYKQTQWWLRCNNAPPRWSQRLATFRGDKTPEMTTYLVLQVLLGKRARELSVSIWTWRAFYCILPNHANLFSSVLFHM